jgi:50S ribosomal subunit-associated GTPase HflX
LHDLNVEKPMLYIFNKADRLTLEEIDLMEKYLRKYTPAVLVSSLSKQGLEPLSEFLANWNTQETPTSD